MSTEKHPADGIITFGRGTGDYVYCFNRLSFYPMRLKFRSVTIKDLTFISKPGCYDSNGSYLFNSAEEAKEYFSFTPQTVARIDILASTSTGPSASNFVKGTLIGGAALGAAAAMATMENTHTVKVTWRDNADSKESIITFNNNQGFQTFIGQLGSLICQPNEATLSNSSPVVSAADEILKFKKLMDEGIITQEEFNAKKKQLLGLSEVEEIKKADTPKEAAVIGGNADSDALAEQCLEKAKEAKRKPLTQEEDELQALQNELNELKLQEEQLTKLSGCGKLSAADLARKRVLQARKNILEAQINQLKK